MPASDEPRRAGSRHELLNQALRFGVTGTLATLTHFLIVWAVVSVSGEASAPFANFVAFWGATSISFFLNTRWSFGKKPDRAIALRYVTVSVACSAAAFIVSSLAHGAALDYRIGVFLVVLTVTPLAFVLHRTWTYGPKAPRGR